METLSAHLAVSKKDLLLGCLPHLFAYCLPPIAAKENGRMELLVSAHGKKANRCENAGVTLVSSTANKVFFFYAKRM